MTYDIHLPVFSEAPSLALIFANTKSTLTKVQLPIFMFLCELENASQFLHKGIDIQKPFDEIKDNVFNIRKIIQLGKRESFHLKHK